jgi:hypothetical protein
VSIILKAKSSGKDASVIINRKTAGILLSLILLSYGSANATDYTIVDTGQDHCYNNSNQIICPDEGEPFYGQDSQFENNPPAYQDNGDGTVTDLNTGLMWQQTPDLDNKYTFPEAVAAADTFSLAGYSDWRLASIKELYSLIDFRGNVFTYTPYIDTNYFDFRYGDTLSGERIIDAQYWSSAEYVGLTMNGDATVFGVNFADGRIKGYPRDFGPNGQPMTQFVRYVRGTGDYGINNFIDNGDGTISDLATGLMWQKADDGNARNWEAALAYADGLTLAGYDDWRLPNAKELQSIVDYTHAPDAVDPDLIGPAIDSVFEITNIGTQQDPDYGYYWTGTTHLDGPIPQAAVYLTFGCAWGWMEQPPNSGNYVLWNVHGAGAQRSDFKSGNPANWPHGHGPQGDVVRIYNYVLCVRNANITGDIEQSNLNLPDKNILTQNYPNPFNANTTIQFYLAQPSDVTIEIYDLLGRKIESVTPGFYQAGNHRVAWDSNNNPSGIYFYRLTASGRTEARKMILLR